MTTSVATESLDVAKSRTLIIANNTPLHSSALWEDWHIEGGDAFLRQWDAWNRKCVEENQRDSEVPNVLEKIWKTLQGMLDKARERGQQVLQSELLKAALDLIPDSIGFPAGALIKALVQLILLGLVSLSLSAHCHTSHSTQKLAGAKRQVYDFTIEVVTDMNRIAGAFGKGTSDAKALHQCWEDLEETRLASKIPLFR